MAVRFLLVNATIDADMATLLCPGIAPGGTLERYEIVQPVIARTDALRLTCCYAGFVHFSAGQLAALDGDEPVLAPFDGAVLLAPRPDPKAGQQAFSWGRVVKG